MVYFLAFTMIVITALIYMTGRCRIISPIMVYMVPFSFSAFWLTLNVSRWSVVLNLNTYLVIVGGSLCLLLGTVVASASSKTISIRNRRSIIRKHDDSEQIPSIFFVIMMVIELVIVFLCFRKIRSIVHSFGYYGSISYEIYRFRNLGMYTTESTSLGRNLDWMYNFNLSMGYIWAYVLALRIFKKNRINIPLVMCLVFSISTGLIRGGRQSAIQIIVAGLMYYMVFLLSGRETRKLPVKTMIMLGGLVIIMAVSFQRLGTLLGRTVQADFMQYLAVYLSGSIRNLNEWLKTPHELPDLFGKMSFQSMYTYLGRKFGRPEWVYLSDLPYLSANGRNSGNIYTMFYSYIYDFGYIGAAVMPFFIGLISQITYNISSKCSFDSERDIRFSTILYGYFSYNLAFSFFGNKFYAGIFTLNFIKFVILWILMIYIINILPMPHIMLLNRNRIRKTVHKISDGNG